MAEQLQLDLDIKTNVSKALSQFDKLNKSVDGITASALSMGSAFEFAKKAFLPLLAIDTLFRTVDTLISSANVLDDTFKTLASISRQTGENLDDLKSSAINLASDGLIPLEDSALAIRNLLRGGLNIDQANKLLKSFKETAALGRAEGISLADAIKNASLAFNQAASTGFQSVNVKLLRSAGIFIDVKQANDAYAKSIGTTAKALTVQQKEQALLNAINEQGAKSQGDYAKIQDDFSAGLTKITAEIKLAVGALGLLFTENNGVKGSLTLVGQAAELVRVNVQAMTGQIKEAELQATKTNFAFNILNKILDNYGFQQILTREETQKSVETTKQLVKGINSLGESFAKKLPTDTINDIKKNLESVGILIKEVNDKAKIKLDVNTDLLTKELENIQKQLKNIGETEIAQVRNDFDARNKIILDSFRSEIIDEKKKNELIVKSRQKLAFDSIKANDEIAKRQQEAIDRARKIGADNPVKVLIEAIIPQSFIDFFKAKPENKKSEAEKEIDLFQEKLGAAGKALVATIGQGALGAKNLLSKGVEAAASAFGPAFGPIAGELFNVLSSGPDAVRGIVDSFTSAIPTLIENFIISIPIFIERLIVGLSNALVTLTDRLPEIIIGFIKGLVHAAPLVIESLVMNAPKVILALIKGIPRLISGLAGEMPTVAVAFSTALVAQAPSIGVAVANAIVDELKGKIGGLAGGAGDVLGSIGGFVSDIGSSFGFARGGELMGGSPLRDSIPVMAQGGELFVKC